MKMQTTPFAERGSGHTATIGLLPRQKHAVINESCALCSLHLMSSSSNYATTSLANGSILLSNHAAFLGDNLSAAT